MGIRSKPTQSLFGLLLLLFTLYSMAAPVGPVIGKVTLVLGTVSGVDQDGDSFEIVRGADLYAGYTLETGRRSMVRAEMNDGTRLTLSQNSDATLDNFSFNAAAGTGGFNATVRRGGFQYSSGQLGKFSLARQHSAISTPAGIIGIRGTIIKATITGRKIILQVTQGNVAFTVGGGSGGTTQTIEVGVDENNQVISVNDQTVEELGASVPQELQEVITFITEQVEEAGGDDSDVDASEEEEDEQNEQDEEETDGEVDGAEDDEAVAAEESQDENAEETTVVLDYTEQTDESTESGGTDSTGDVTLGDEPPDLGDLISPIGADSSN